MAPDPPTPSPGAAQGYWAAPLPPECIARRPEGVLPTDAFGTMPRSFLACASCARAEHYCECEHGDLKSYSGDVVPPVRTLTPATQRALNKLPRGRRRSVDIEVELTDLGWRVTARQFGTLFPYVATLRACGCRRASLFPVTVCLKADCTKTFGRHAHCHQGQGTGRTKHRENVEAFVVALARTYAGCHVATPEVPAHPAEAPTSSHELLAAAAEQDRLAEDDKVQGYAWRAADRARQADDLRRLARSLAS